MAEQPVHTNLLEAFVAELLGLQEKSGEPVTLRYQDGCISTPGCEGDYGCCSKQLDIVGLLDDLQQESKS